ncbi:MAG: AAA family ATPase [Thermoguttaceae bacterium]|nr:AAA family ATPase [Thermoguttaceae bacterium]MDW8079589.1 AAA family ATPase [Thermoguttaceae bacterium]
MSNVLRVAIVDPDDRRRDTLKQQLLGIDLVWLEAECSRYEFFADVVAQATPEIGIVGLDADPEKALRLVERVVETVPQCDVLVTSSSSDGNLILQAMRAGAKEFLTWPIRLEDLLAALGRISERRFGRSDSRPRGCQVITVAGCSGGVGSSSIAVNLACALAAREKNSVVLVDLDLALGDADLLLDTLPDYTIADLAQNITRLDYTLLKRSLTRHACGLYLLPRPMQLEDIPLVTPEDFQRIVGLLKATFTHLVIDISKAFNQLDLLALEMANHILLVTQLELASLRNVVRLLSSFKQTEGLAQKVKIVVNRVGLDSGHISIKKAQETIGQEFYWQIPNDYRTMIEARNNGVPLIEYAPRAQVTQAIVALAESLTTPASVGSATSGAKRSGRGLLWLISGKA